MWKHDANDMTILHYQANEYKYNQEIVAQSDRMFCSFFNLIKLFQLAPSFCCLWCGVGDP